MMDDQHCLFWVSHLRWVPPPRQPIEDDIPYYAGENAEEEENPLHLLDTGRCIVGVSFHIRPFFCAGIPNENQDARPNQSMMNDTEYDDDDDQAPWDLLGIGRYPLHLVSTATRHFAQACPITSRTRMNPNTIMVGPRGIREVTCIASSLSSISVHKHPLVAQGWPTMLGRRTTHLTLDQIKVCMCECGGLHACVYIE